jgi:hypothetical protein
VFPDSGFYACLRRARVVPGWLFITEHLRSWRKEIVKQPTTRNRLEFGVLIEALGFHWKVAALLSIRLCRQTSVVAIQRRPGHCPPYSLARKINENVEKIKRGENKGYWLVSQD